MTQEYLFIDYRMWGDIMNGFVEQLERCKRMGINIYNFSHVYGIPRGGGPIAVHISHHFKIDMIEDIDLNYPPDYFGPHDNLLIVDDITDTGKTCQAFRAMCEAIQEDTPTFQYKLASIHVKPRSVCQPDIYMQTVPDDTWVVYPWEKCEDCDLEQLDFKLRRQKELAMETGKPIITATQRPMNTTQQMAKGDRK